VLLPPSAVTTQVLLPPSALTTTIHYCHQIVFGPSDSKKNSAVAVTQTPMQDITIFQPFVGWKEETFSISYPL